MKFYRIVALFVALSMAATPATFAKGGGGGGGHASGHATSAHTTVAHTTPATAPVRVAPTTPATAARTTALPPTTPVTAARTQVAPPPTTPVTAAPSPTTPGKTVGVTDGKPANPALVIPGGPAKPASSSAAAAPAYVPPATNYTGADNGGGTRSTMGGMLGVAAGAAVLGAMAGAAIASPSDDKAVAYPAPILTQSAPPVYTTPIIPSTQPTTEAPTMPIVVAPPAQKADVFDHAGAMLASGMRWAFWIAIALIAITFIAWIVARADKPNLTLGEFLLRKKKQAKKEVDLIWPGKDWQKDSVKPTPAPAAPAAQTQVSEPAAEAKAAPTLVANPVADVAAPNDWSAKADDRMVQCLKNVQEFCCCLNTAELDRAKKVASSSLVNSYDWTALVVKPEFYPDIEEVTGHRAYVGDCMHTRVTLDFGDGVKDIYVVSFGQDNRLRLLEKF